MGLRVGVWALGHREGLGFRVSRLGVFFKCSGRGPFSPHRRSKACLSQAYTKEVHPRHSSRLNTPAQTEQRLVQRLTGAQTTITCHGYVSRLRLRSLSPAGSLFLVMRRRRCCPTALGVVVSPHLDHDGLFQGLALLGQQRPHLRGD